MLEELVDLSLNLQALRLLSNYDELKSYHVTYVIICFKCKWRGKEKAAL